MVLEKNDSGLTPNLERPQTNRDKNRFTERNNQIEAQIKAKDPMKLFHYINFIGEYNANETAKSFNHELKKIYNYLMKCLQNDLKSLQNHPNLDNLKNTLKNWGPSSPYYMEKVPRARALDAWDNIYSLLFPSADGEQKQEVRDLERLKRQNSTLQRIFNEITSFFKSGRAPLEETEGLATTQLYDKIERHYKKLLSDGQKYLNAIKQFLENVNPAEQAALLSEYAILKKSCEKSKQQFEKAFKYEDPHIIRYLCKFQIDLDNIKDLANRSLTTNDIPSVPDHKKTHTPTPVETVELATPPTETVEHDIIHTPTWTPPENITTPKETPIDDNIQNTITKEITRELLDKRLETFKKDGLKDSRLSDKEKELFACELRKNKNTKNIDEFLTRWDNIEHKLKSIKKSNHDQYNKLFEYHHDEAEKFMHKYSTRATGLKSVIDILKDTDNKLEEALRPPNRDRTSNLMKTTDSKTTTHDRHKDKLGELEDQGKLQSKKR